MPFTESNRPIIYIHDLMIEHPVASQKERLFDPMTDLSSEERTTLSNMHDNHTTLVNKKVLGFITHLTPKLRSSLDYEFVGIVSDQPEFLNQEILKLKIYRCMLGWEQTPTNEELISLQNSAAPIDLWRAKAMGVGGEPTDDWQKYIDEQAERPLLNMPLLVMAKLGGYKVNINPTDLHHVKKNWLNPRNDFKKLIGAASDLAILSADEIQYGPNGIELIYNDATSTNLNTTPPIPNVRNF